MTDNNSLSRRGFLKATGGAASAIAIAGCSGGNTNNSNGNNSGGSSSTSAGSSQTSSAGGSGNKTPAGGKNTLRLINGGISTLDPIKASDTESGRVIQQMFDGLTMYPNGEITPKELLAKGHDVSDDYKTYTFKLQQGAKFHNGKEVTADDFVYAWERLVQSKNSRRAYFITDSLGITHDTVTKKDSDGNETTAYKPGSLGVKAKDKYTLEMKLESPFAHVMPMLAYSSFAAVPKGIVGDIQQYKGKGQMSHKKFATSDPVGAGPFKFGKWSQKTEAVVNKFDDYHGTKPNVNTVHWQVITDSEAQYNYAINKNADVFGIPTSKFLPSKQKVDKTDDKGREIGSYQFKNGSKLKYVGTPTINTYYYAFNQKNVDEPAVRKAFAYVLNQQQIVKQVFKGRGKPAYHFTPPGIYPGGAKAYTKHAKDKYPYGYNKTDMQKAQKVMKDAGYGPNNQYKFTMTVYKSSTAFQQATQIMQSQLRNVYINMKTEVAPFSTLLERGRKGNLEGYTLGWIMDWPAPDNFLQNLVPKLTVTSQPGGATGAYVDWQGTKAAKRANSDWNKISDNPAPTDSDQKIRDKNYIDMEEANWEDVVLLPVYHELDELYHYDWVDIQPFGDAGFSRMKLNNVKLNRN